ncbi:NusG domain II-containing protein [Kaarinaea lacus]
MTLNLQPEKSLFTGDYLRRGDYIVALSALILLIIMYAYFWRSALYGQQAAIAVQGQHWLNVNLAHDQIIDVPGKLGISTIHVHDGKIRFLRSPCDNKQCIHQGWLSQGGELAACLPNQVSVQILSDDPRFDSINF